MKITASSKRIKKKFDEDRGRKKRTKSNKRRRIDSSSHSEDSSLSRRKTSRRESKRPRRDGDSSSKRRRQSKRRRKQSKSPEKQKTRKPPRHRRDAGTSSDSSSSRSCSTCRGRSSSPLGDSDSDTRRCRSRSRSYIRKAQSRDRGRSKGRSGDVRSRYRPRSCSTCSGSTSRSRSQCDEKSRKKDVPRPLGTKESGEGRDETAAIRAYDDFGTSRSDVIDTAYRQASEKKRKVEETVSVGKGSRYAQREYKSGEDVVSFEANTHPAKIAGEGGCDPLMRESRQDVDPCARKSCEVVADTDGPKADDLELILRQKALENFRKFRGGASANARSVVDRKDESSDIESRKNAVRAVEETQLCQIAQSSGKLTEQKSCSSPRNNGETKGEDNQIGFVPKFVANLVASCPGDNVSSKSSGDFKIINSNKSQNTQNKFNRAHEPSRTMLSEQASYAKENIQEKGAVKELTSGSIQRADGNVDDGSASGISCLNMETEISKSVKPVEGGSGAQFEKKTFSRLHDGEMVQVSYKVYIPKKTPALARRQLQR